MRAKLGPALLVLVITPWSALRGQSVGPIAMPDFLGERAHEEPPRLAPRTLAAPLAHLPAAAVGARDQMTAIERWNEAGRRPMKNGFRRGLPLPQAVRLPGDRSAADAGGSWDGGVLARRAGGGLVWGTRVDVEGAYRLRLHLADVKLPAGTRLWVFAEHEARGPFGAELVGPGGDLWTPSVAGSAIWIEVELPAAGVSPAAGYGFAVTDVMEILRPAAPSRLVAAPLAASTSCLVDGACVTASQLGIVAQYRAAVASLDFVVGGESAFCSGALLNDTQSSLTPYLLTADHCVASQAVAATVEAVWDYYDSTCLGAFPDRSTLPASEGATLLAASLASDFSLLRLSSLPSGRFFLGWNASITAVSDGTALYRLSHPEVFPQAYSVSRAARSAPRACPPESQGRPLNDAAKFIHSVATVAAVLPGSSGAPVVLANGQVVGQLFGGCGSSAAIADPCLAPDQLDQIDGAFSATFPAVAAWLSPTATSAPCVPGATTLCIDDQPGDRRFKAEVSFETAGAAPAPGNAVPLASLGVSSGGLFWFFNPGNPEMLVKVLNGCALGGHYWVFYAAGTNVGLSTTVTDTVTGAHKTYTNPLGTAAPPVEDTSALPCS